MHKCRGGGSEGKLAWRPCYPYPVGNGCQPCVLWSCHRAALGVREYCCWCLCRVPTRRDPSGSAFHRCQLSASAFRLIPVHISQQCFVRFALLGTLPTHQALLVPRLIPPGLPPWWPVPSVPELVHIYYHLASASQDQASTVSTRDQSVMRSGCALPLSPGECCQFLSYPLICFQHRTARHFRAHLTSSPLAAIALRLPAYFTD